MSHTSEDLCSNRYWQWWTCPIPWFRYRVSCGLLDRTFSCFSKSNKPHGKPCSVPITCATLFSDLSSMFPVCALLIPTPEVVNLMSDLCNGLEVRKLPEQWQFLQENVPVLHDLICKIGPENMSLPSEFRPLVIDMVHKAQLPFVSTPLHPRVPVSAQSNNTHSYFPCLPVLWDWHRYKSDKHKDTLSCTKLYRGHPSLLPGIFTIFCPHGLSLLLLHDIV